MVLLCHGDCFKHIFHCSVIRIHVIYEWLYSSAFNLNKMKKKNKGHFNSLLLTLNVILRPVCFHCLEFLSLQKQCNCKFLLSPPPQLLGQGFFLILGQTCKFVKLKCMNPWKVRDDCAAWLCIFLHSMIEGLCNRTVHSHDWN